MLSGFGGRMMRGMLRRPRLLILAGFFVSTMSLGCGVPPDSQGDVRLVDTGGGGGDTASRPDAGGGGETGAREMETDAAIEPSLPYAAGVVEFSAGDGAGTGQQAFPDVVLGPPEGEGPNKGSLDVLSLGAAGEIVVDFGDRAIVDQEGADFIVFENPFYVGGSPEDVYQELGEVSVSADGETWHTFDCDTEPAKPGRWPGCAGWRPVEDYDPQAMVPLKPALTGGDPFDLADIGVEEARYVRIEDVSRKGSAPSAGFDLDGVGVIHGRADSGAQ